MEYKEGVGGMTLTTFPPPYHHSEGMYEIIKPDIAPIIAPIFHFFIIAPVTLKSIVNQNYCPPF